MGALVVDRWLTERRPSPALADVLRCTWTGDLGEMTTPLPDECVDLVWVADGSLWVSGPESRSWPRGYPPGSRAVGVRFQPGVGPAVLGVAGHQLLDVRVPLDGILGDRTAGPLLDRLAARPDDAGRVQELEHAVRALVDAGGPVDRVARAVADAVGSVRRPSVRALARDHGLSERQLHRRSAAAFGYGPSVLARIRRLERTLRLARTSRPRSLAELAGTAGYADQAHLAHDVRSITGTTPGRLLRLADV